MNGFAFILIAYFALNALAAVFMIGRRRETLTPGGAVICLILYALLIWLVFAAVSA